MSFSSFIRADLGYDCADSDLLNNLESLAPIYVALRAYQSFIDSTTSSSSNATRPAIAHPGFTPSNIETDTAALLSHAQEYLQTISTRLTLTEPFPGEKVEKNIGDWCREVVRYGGAELHNIAALAGGVVAQEVIKIFTRQYVPVGNTVVFDGVRSSVQCWEL